MSTEAILKRAIEGGSLWHLIPELGDPPKRSLLIHSELKQLFDDYRHLRPIGAMKGYLESFVTGGRMVLGMTPHEHGTASMGRLDPTKEGAWEFRCRDPSPATRVFGVFPCRDVFVALDWAPRSRPIPGIDRRPLGDTLSLEWQFALIETGNRWGKVCGGLNPLVGSKASDYLSENFFEV